MFIEFTVDGVKYEFSESDMDSDSEFAWGYDIYLASNPQGDPINLGEIAYFDHKPTQEDAENWIRNFGE